MSNSDKGFMNAYGKPGIPLPNGEVLTCEPMPLKRCVHWMRIGERADAGELEATYEICDEEKGFFKEIGIAKNVESLTPREAMVVFWTFFTVNRFIGGKPKTSRDDAAQPSTTSS